MSPWATLAAPTYAIPLDVFRVMVGVLSVAYFARTWSRGAPVQRPGRAAGPRPPAPPAPVHAADAHPARRLAGTCCAPVRGRVRRRLLLIAGVRCSRRAVPVPARRLHVPLEHAPDVRGRRIHAPRPVLDGALADGPHPDVPGPLGESRPGAGRLVGGRRCRGSRCAASWPTSPSCTSWRACGSGRVRYGERAGRCTPPSGWPSPIGPTRRQPSQGSWLRLGNYVALVVEPFLALLAFLPAYSPLKSTLFVCAVGFHVGIVVTKKFPFANLAMLGAGVIYFRQELMDALGAPALRPAPGALPPTLTDWLAFGTVSASRRCSSPTRSSTAIIDPTLADLVARRPRLNPFYVPLWALGLAQSYRLFDWIDDRNFRVDYEVAETRPGRPPPGRPGRDVPRSMRHVLLQSYLHGNIWMKLDPACSPELREGILAGTRAGTVGGTRRLAARRSTSRSTPSCSASPSTTWTCTVARESPAALHERGRRDRVTGMCLTPPDYR